MFVNGDKSVPDCVGLSDEVYDGKSDVGVELKRITLGLKSEGCADDAEIANGNSVGAKVVSLEPTELRGTDGSTDRLTGSNETVKIPVGVNDGKSVGPRDGDSIGASKDKDDDGDIEGLIEGFSEGIRSN